MPDYTPTVWENETPAESPVRFTIRDQAGAVLYDNVTIDLKTVVTPGTPLDSTKMNHIEQGIKAAQDTANAQVTLDKLVTGILSADAAGRAKMADGFITLLKMSSDLRFQKLFEYVASGGGHPYWNNIPQTFRHLVMVYTGVSSRESSGLDYFWMHINGDVGANYSTFLEHMDSTGLHFNRNVTNPHTKGLLAGALPAQSAGTLATGSGIVLFPDYRGTTFYKSAISLSIAHGASEASMVFANTNRVNTEPITRLSGYMVEGETYPFPRAGSVFSLYGFN
jgi:hypothetical protein